MMNRHQEDSEYLTEMRTLIRGPASISFAQGSPGTETLNRCKDMFLQASQNLLNQDVDVVFKYGPARGSEQFLEQLSRFLSQEYGNSVNSTDLMVTAGATQGLHLILSLLCQPACPVFVPDPTYFLAFRVIRDDLLMNLQPVPEDNEGINKEILDKMLTAHKPKARSVLPGYARYWAAVYLVPVFSNPTGLTYSADCCKKLVQLARKHDVLLIADDVYNMLYFTDTNKAPPRLISFDKKTDLDYGRGHVISNGTFSKILAPSLRLGWIESSAEIILILSGSNVADSGGCFNQYTSLLVTSILKTGVLHEHAKCLRQTYKERMEILCATLDEHLPEGCTYYKPEGGFFLWICFIQDVDAFKFVRFAIKNYDISFLPGTCSSPSGSFRNCARLSISSMSLDQIQKGATIFCQAYQHFLNTLETQ